MNTFKIPFISGKDSLSSTYRYPDGRMLHIPPVLCISAMGKIPDIQKTTSADFKKADSLIVVVGTIDQHGMGGSTYLTVTNQDKPYYKIPEIDHASLPARFATMHSLIAQGIVTACHDISEGGIAVALAEMCFGNTIGADINLGNQRPDFFLFAETAGCFFNRN